VNTSRKQTALARRRHSVGGGGAPISYDRRRRRQQNVGGGGGAQLYPNPNPNPTIKQHAIMSIVLNIVTCPMYPDKFVRDTQLCCTVVLL